MSTQRVDSDDVQEIFPSTIDFQPFITTASVIVSERLVGHYSEARLTEIERWLSAHLASSSGAGASGSGSGAGQVSEIRADEITVRYSTGAEAAALASTRYGQHVMLLDYKGILTSMTWTAISAPFLRALSHGNAGRDRHRTGLGHPGTGWCARGRNLHESSGAHAGFGRGQVTGVGTSVQVSMLLRGYHSNEIDGVAITSRDLLARIPVAEFAMIPTTRDTVLWNAEKWSVLAVKKAANGGLWSLQLRKPGPP